MALPVIERNHAALNHSRQEDVNREQAANGPFILNPRPGRTTFRVLGPYDSKGMWWFEYELHNFFAAGPTPFRCIADSQGRCPICEHGASLSAQGNEEAAKNFKATTKFLLNTIIFSDSTGKNTVKSGVIAMEVGVMVKKALLDLDLDVNGGYGDITNYTNGFDVNMDKVGTKFQTKYTVKVNPQRNDLFARLKTEGIDPESLNLQPLDQLRPELPYDVLKGAFEAALNGTTPVKASTQPVAVAASPAVTQPVQPVTAFKAPSGPQIGGLKITPPPLPGKK